MSTTDEAVDELVELARRAGAGLLLALDFDGTLAPIVPNPQDSAPLPGVLDALRRLTARGVHVGIVTGRDALTAVRLGRFETVPGIVVEGLYGAERWHEGTLDSLAEPESMRQLRERLPVTLAENGADPKVWVEDKRLSLVVHGRLADDPEAALAPLQAPVRALAEQLGLEVHLGKGVIEVRLPGYDKAAALRRLADANDPAVVIYVGDDVGDFPAFGEVRRLRAHGTPGYAVGVRSPDVLGLDQVTDLQLDDPAEVVELLRRLAE